MSSSFMNLNWLYGSDVYFKFEYLVLLCGEKLRLVIRIVLRIQIRYFIKRIFYFVPNVWKFKAETSPRIFISTKAEKFSNAFPYLKCDSTFIEETTLL